ncbi:F-box/LRR-repeat protein 25-like [Rutidosis leptorrhynchoides]|uniref:F-box/LRR-repeat protein 25-like n=1 Tax=Rutidosis leptorrhynchoides TaxID=125765 RepID=UPI003A994768
MKFGKRIRLIRTTQLEDIPVELIHRIQSFLPEKEAARTCVLSKSWLHAWSTIPTLRFTQKQESGNMNLIDRTLVRYFRDNMSIESFHLDIEIKNQESAFIVETWIQQLVSKRSLKELHLTIKSDECLFTLSHEIFLSENLKTLRLRGDRWFVSNLKLVKCVFLRELELMDFEITEDVIDNLTNVFPLLEKINLSCLSGLTTVKVKNFRYLRELRIAPREEIHLEIDNVPNLRLFHYNSLFNCLNKIVSYSNVDSLGNVKELVLSGMSMDDDPFFDSMISSIFPSLEILTLENPSWSKNTLNMSNVVLKKLTLRLGEYKPIKVQINAPNLILFCYKGYTIPNLEFLTVSPNESALN